MKKIIPILTEKTLNEAKEGRYAFWVDNSWNKYKISEAISKLYSVDIKSVRTVNYKKLQKRNYMGRYKKIPSRKKALVTLKGKGKIDIFESKS
ncbi:50S ribosomal protein L23 [Candidatus Woesebacteria bacterium]|nr:50S ribosomal protein L23 [Candidatus Woesebacteria bacterium]